MIRVLQICAAVALWRAVLRIANRTIRVVTTIFLWIAVMGIMAYMWLSTSF